ncbi:MAG TPA: hypothetical protein VLF87_00720 [Patescibacteria group bacterium]|nr:hypothetical protein [Patescibacteria group bacterium]
MSFKKLVTSLALTAAAVIMPLAAPGLAHAAGCFQYSNNGDFFTSHTPVFNNICGDPTPINSTEGPVPIGNESDFVRIRPDTSGDVTSNKNNPALRNSLTTACKTGDKFDVWTYIHNDAVSQDNNNGTGSAVAKDVKLAMTAPIGQNNDNPYTFKSTISASNATPSSVSDTAFMTCNGKKVKLTLVTNTVKYTTNVASPSFAGLPDSAVNGVTSLGNPVFGSGMVWGCWNYRIVVVYQVTVQEVPEQQSLGECKVADFSVDFKSRKVTVNSITPSLTNATVVGHKVNWGDGSAEFTDQNANFTAQSHTYAKDGTYNVVTSVHVKFADGHMEWKTSSDCARSFTFAPNQENCTVPGKESFPKNSPECKETPSSPPTPTSLPNTGAGNIAGIFGAVTVAGALIHRFVLSRKFGN